HLAVQRRRDLAPLLNVSLAIKANERVAAKQRLVGREPAEQLAERERAVAVGEDRLGILRRRGYDQLRTHREIDQEAFAELPQWRMPPVRLIEAAAVTREVPDSNPRQGVQCTQRTLVGFWVAAGAGGHCLPPNSIKPDGSPADVRSGLGVVSPRHTDRAATAP